MSVREQLIECLDEIEDGMKNVKYTDDIWQNKLVYILCQAVRLLILHHLKNT